MNILEMDEIVNKVAQSGLITIDLQELFPEGRRENIDIAGQLWQGIALREKEFREWIRLTDWTDYRDSHVAIFCSADAIIPNWAYMLVSSALAGIARSVTQGTPSDRERILFRESIAAMDREKFRDARVIIKGCSEKEVPVSAYSDVVQHLRPVVRSLMFGEACSTVPVFKR